MSPPTPIKVEFKPKDRLSRPEKAAVKEQHIQDVQNAEAPKGAVLAVIVGSRHTSHSDPRNHITVDYLDDKGNLILRDHVI
ncbi:MAG: hypothetical protein M4579_007379 [Chaenotheca gracillima]|nr:MAG: hypothetical protein M4579_007379 [Chaenotheca gracillima]